MMDRIIDAGLLYELEKVCTRVGATPGSLRRLIRDWPDVFEPGVKASDATTREKLRRLLDLGPLLPGPMVLDWDSCSKMGMAELVAAGAYQVGRRLMERLATQPALGIASPCEIKLVPLLPDLSLGGARRRIAELDRKHPWQPAGACLLLAAGLKLAQSIQSYFEIIALGSQPPLCLRLRRGQKVVSGLARLASYGNPRDLFLVCREPMLSTAEGGAIHG